MAISTSALVCRLVLAAVFGVAGVAKLADREGSRSALAGFGVPDRMTRAGAVALPAVELIVAAGLLIPRTAWWSAVVAACLLAGFAAAILVNLVRGREPECHCFGRLHSAPAGWSTLLRNAGLTVLAAAVLVAGPDEMRSPVSWLTGLSSAEAILAATVAVLAIVAAVEANFLVRLLRQNGRILSRLGSLEAALGLAPPGANPATKGGSDSSGLTLGSPAPDFDLPDLDGARVSLESLLSRRLPVLLVFVDPACGPCSAMLPEVGSWQRERSAELTVAVVSRGSAEDNRARAGEHDLSGVLLQEDSEIATAFQVSGTPAAVLVSAEGRIASPVAFGPEAIRGLAEGKPGVEAPAIEWEDLNGRSIDLRDLRGAPVTLLFWHPHCGFCREMAPRLREWLGSKTSDRQRTIVVSAGSVAENRALDLGLPIVLEDDFRTGTALGVAGTPAAVAINAEGRIVAPPAAGEAAVLRLLDAQVAVGVGP